MPVYITPFRRVLSLVNIGWFRRRKKDPRNNFRKSFPVNGLSLLYQKGSLFRYNYFVYLDFL